MEETMRLQKYMAKCGVASRRKAEEMIAGGRVCVNGQVVMTPGVKVAAGDEVLVDGRRIALEEKEYVLLNKPTGYVSTAEDSHAEHKLVELVKSAHRLYPVGRLDKDTEGLIILTNDGDLTFNLTHPSHEFPKTYLCLVEGHPTAEQVDALRKGVTIPVDEGNYLTAPADVQVVKSRRGSTVLEISIREGKKRQVRKMCDAVGHPVIALKRTAIGRLRDDGLKAGQWRYLDADEIAYLKGGNCD